jgi:hypothetical protein
MSKLNGVTVYLRTGTGRYAGTDDHVYLGVYGPGAGREFALDVDDFDDWEPDSSVDYTFGQSIGVGMDPKTADDQLSNISISLPDITHAYLRKQGDRTQSGDDYWELSDAEVWLAHSSRDYRAFTLPGTARLGNEYGHKVWLREYKDVDEELDDQRLQEVRARFEQDQE